MKALRRFTVRAHLPERLAALERLSVNLRWSWDKPTQDLFAAIDPDAVARRSAAIRWRCSARSARNVWTNSPSTSHSSAGWTTSPPSSTTTWLARCGIRNAQPTESEMPNGIAYFSMEFGVAEVLPNYSGGLGILAGDHLKSASDLGLPLIAVGLYYRSGYFRQSLTADGWQRENYPSLDPQGLPLRLLTDHEGDPVLVELAMPDSAQLRARVWVAQVGRIPLLLLDSDIPENEHDLRGVTDRLYGGDQEHRIKQEILAGIGGVRAIRAFTEIEGLPTPEVFHMNEGHAGFLGVERIRELIDSGLDFDTALTVVRSSTVFTTHTPVAAGIDRFPVEMVKRYFGSGEGGPAGATSRLLPGVSLDRIIAFGAEDDPSKFNMAHMGLRLAQRANGVSLLHGRVSREMFNELWPGFDPAEVPIGSITNGVHAPTWAAPQWLELGRELLGGDRPRLAAASRQLWERLQQVDPGHLWWIRSQLRGAAGRRRPGAAASVLARARRIGRRTGLDRNGFRSGCADGRVRAAGAHVQAVDADAARSGPAGEAAARREAAHPADRGGQVASRRRGRQGADPAGGAVRRPARGAAPHRVPARLRHVDGPPAVLGLRRLAEQPAAPAGGVRHVGNEERAQRRAEPVHPRRLVGRVVRRRERLGDTDRRRAGRREPARRPGGRRALQPARDGRWRRSSTTATTAASRCAGSRWCATRWRCSGPKVLASRMVRDYTEKYYAPAAQSLRRTVEPREDGGVPFGAARDLAAYRQRAQEAWPKIQITDVDSTGLPDTPLLGSELTLTATVQLAGLRPDEVVGPGGARPGRHRRRADRSGDRADAAHRHRRRRQRDLLDDDAAAGGRPRRLYGARPATSSAAGLRHRARTGDTRLTLHRFG